MEAAYPNLVLVVRKNRFLGWMLLPYLTIRENKNFLTAEQAFSTMEFARLTATWEIKLYELALNLDLQELANRFSKKKVQANPFFESVSSQILEEAVLPFVWKQMHKILLLALENNIPVYVGFSWPNLYPDQLLHYPVQAGKTELHFKRTAEKTLYQLKVFHEGKQLNLQHDTLLLSQEPCLLIHQQKILHFEEEINGKLFLPFLKKDMIEIPRRAEKQYFERFIKKFANRTDIHAEGFELIDLIITPKPQLRMEQNWDGTFGLTLSFDYNNKIIYPQQKQLRFTSLHANHDGFIFKRFRRNLKLENSFIDRIKKLDFIQDQAFFQLKETSKNDPNNNSEKQLYALVTHMQNLKEEFDKQNIKITQHTEKVFLLAKPHLQTDYTVERDWFDLHMMVKAGELEFPFVALKNHILNGERIYKLKNGQSFLIPEAWFSQYRGLLVHSSHAEFSQLRLKRQHDMLIPDSKVYDPQEIFPKKASELLPYPTLHKTQLRTYQKIGFQWLGWLTQQAFGGILADDMGLGKTLQIISLLAHNYPNGSLSKKSTPLNTLSPGTQLDLFATSAPKPEEPKENLTQKPSLIVMPASLIHNWINELKRFAPHLSYINYTGTDRKLSEKQWRAQPIILTTYGTLRNDIEILKTIDFKFVILDESQAIKNASSKTAAAAYALAKETGIAMTGTPIENSLYDLWSQMEFANPGLLGNQDQFENYYVTPLTKFGDEAAADSLKRIIKPFILRRTKQSVVTELPPLTEIISYCEMLPDQQELYETEKSQLRNVILHNQESPEQKVALPVLVLRALMRLRQIANHPALAHKDVLSGSGKFQLVTEKLTTLLDEGQKVLIFSSFTTHLKLYAKWLDAEKHQYAMLTGSTRNREKMIQGFKDDDQTQVFLISLKAGGFGLNLTEAGYVFMLDPWWNPAAELQALSRAHRIGQDKKVFVYRFISKDTVEEKILGLQQYKTDLADQILETTAISKPKIEEMMRLLE
ncbi:MAG TPA: DEAD/DEAH box helicase [Bacteroidales bacterium]|nr:DEAD/DEAH box helicase [Bacteroidales bacterium]